MKQYYAYTRISSQKQSSGTSLSVQKQLIKKYAKINKLNISEWFDETKTAATTKRTVFRNLVSKLERHKADGLILHTIDRGARNLKDWALLGELTDKGIDVRFVQENIDLNSRGGRLSADIQAVIAADYVRNLREETKKGLNYRLQQGLYPFSAPIGYVDNGSGKVKTVDAERAPFIQEGFNLYSKGNLSLICLADKIHTEGLRSRSLKKINHKAWSNILRNPFYTGTIKISNSTYPGLHEPLITEELFDAVQVILISKGINRKTRNVFLFQKLLICDQCGYKLIGERQKGHVYYRCHSKRHTCSVREDRAEELMLTFFRKMKSDIEWVERVEKIIYQITMIKLKKEYIKAQRLSVYSLEQRQENLRKLYSEGLIRKQSLQQEEESLHHQIERIKSRLNATHKQLRDIEKKDACYRNYLLGNSCAEMNQRDKRRIIYSLNINFLVNNMGNFTFETKC